VVLLDKSNRPYLATPRPFAASSPGEPLSFFADALPGIVASKEPPSTRSGGEPYPLAIRLRSDRDEPLDVEIVLALGGADTLVSSSVPPDRTQPRRARFVVGVPAHGTATLELQLTRP
jgi:hypothetical protein